jgi:hypothetical protein
LAEKHIGDFGASGIHQKSGGMRTMEAKEHKKNDQQRESVVGFGGIEENDIA